MFHLRLPYTFTGVLHPNNVAQTVDTVPNPLHSLQRAGYQTTPRILKANELPNFS